MPLYAVGSTFFSPIVILYKNYHSIYLETRLENYKFLSDSLALNYLYSLIIEQLAFLSIIDTIEILLLTTIANTNRRRAECYYVNKKITMYIDIIMALVR